MNTIFSILGGVGVFLLGMIIMTDGLKQLAGDAMRQLIMRFTHNAPTGAVTGAITTAVLQSSSATTVAAVGFVGAGLLTFTESLGIIFGANIGTTITGWLVVLVGFKLSLADFMLPVIFIGVALKLFASKKIASAGLALAGFGLIFVGISTLQDAMSSLHGSITPDIFPDDTLVGRLQLFLLGALITVITQSSSAGVAMALTALFAGAINFEQAAAMVIGMDVGTTSTAAMATIGGKVSARRTGLSHVIYNMMTGLGAMLLLTPFAVVWESISPGGLINNAEIALVAFHTTFNALGVLIVLPFANAFALFIQNVIPEKESIFTSGLDRTLLKDNGMAITGLSSAVIREVNCLLQHLLFLLSNKQQGTVTDLEEMQQVLDKTHDFADHIHIKDEKEMHRVSLLALIHALDHMQRLHERLEEDIDRAETVLNVDELDGYRLQLIEFLNDISRDQSVALSESLHKMLSAYQVDITDYAQAFRQQTMERIAAGLLSVDEGNKHLEAVRWLRRVSLHINKIMSHLSRVAENKDYTV